LALLVRLEEARQERHTATLEAWLNMRGPRPEMGFADHFFEFPRARESECSADIPLWLREQPGRIRSLG
jgi:hypothetical protein